MMTANNGTIAVLGAKGMLGSDLVKALLTRGCKVDQYDLPEFDITDIQQLEQIADSHQKIINCAAYTNVEQAESEPEKAFAINAQAVGTLAQLAKKANCRLCHISTDFVFDGFSDRPYSETDIPSPINTYGRSKLAGEELFLRSDVDGCIIRLQWTYGNSGNNFIKKIIEQARKNNSLKVVDDQIGSCTWTADAAEAIIELMTAHHKGIFHYAAKGCASRYDIARFIFDKLAISAQLAPCKTSDYITAAARPLNSRFNCDKIQSILAKPIKSWQLSLDKYLEQL